MRTQNSTSITLVTGLNQEDALSSVLSNLTLEKVVRILQENEGGLLIIYDTNKTIIELLGFADDLDILGDSLQTQLTRLEC